jgi:tetratricopeptide (TPR) repeat protein
MKRWHLLFVLLPFAACTGTDTDPLLRQQPFAALTDSIAQQPQTASLYERRATLLLQNEQDALAEKDFRKAYQLQPNEDNAIGTARFLIGRNNDSAILFLEDAVKKVPESLVLQISLARGYQQKQALDKALAICNNIIREYPNQLDALVLKSDVQKAQNKPAESLSTLEQAYQYAPFDPELVHNLAFGYAQAKNARALQLADSLIRADSAQRHAEPYYFKGVYYSNTGNRAAALQQFDEAIRRDYNFLDAHMDKGVLQYEGKQYAAAQNTFERVLTISPAYADAYFWLGKVAQAQQRTAKAREHYLRAFSLDKSLTEAREAADKL